MQEILGSAFVESSASVSEFLDPIIYPNHSFVQSLNERLMSTGSEYDMTNNSAIFNSFPEWISDEDETLGGGALKNLSQIMAGFFDDLFLKIQFFPEIKNVSYREGKPLPFAEKLLNNLGFQTSDLFSDATIIESFLSRNEEKDFKNKLDDIKNIIYQNIYNNLLYIYRSKRHRKVN